MFLGVCLLLSLILLFAILIVNVAIFGLLSEGGKRDGAHKED